ncbi:hypothetical protein MCOR04_011846 [Pyricularia oryzae]|nr:hypothetical protein MCOR17_011928 [Pyricularia oryzae]KAI6544266.1 hypothetical protein MCOR04_011846 [Pyricularia oryzae]
MSFVPAGPAVSTVDSIAGPIIVRRTQDEIWIILPISILNARSPLCRRATSKSGSLPARLKKSGTCLRPSFVAKVITALF